MSVGSQEQSRKSYDDFNYSTLNYIEYRKFSYESCLEYSKNHGIIVKMPLQNSMIPNTNDTSMETTHNPTNNTYRPDHSDQESLHEEGLFGRGLLHYKKWWEQNEVGIVVNGTALTGIPIFIDQNTLRVVNDTHSYFIPLEKIDYICTTDGLGGSAN